MPTQRRSNALRRLALLAPLMGMTMLACAQQGTLDPALATATSLDARATQAIDEHAARWAPQLGADDPAAAALARDRLIRPLAASGVSVTFRLEYASALMPRLRELGASEGVGPRLAAARVAGALGTDDAAEFLLEALRSEDESLRLFAAAQLGETLSQAAAGAAVLTPETADEVVRALGAQISAAENPLEAGAAVRALTPGTRIEQQGFAAIRNQACVQLATNAGKRARALPAASADELELIVALDACSAGRNAVTAQTSRPDAEATKQIVGLGADVLAWGLARFIDNKMPPVGERGLEAQVVGAAENVIYFARRHAASLEGQSAASSPSRVAQALREGDDRTFRTAALALLGRDGELVRQFGFNRDRFLDRAP